MQLGRVRCLSTGDVIEMMVFVVMVVAVATVVALRLLRCLAVENGIVELVLVEAVDLMPMGRWQTNAMVAVVAAAMV